MSAFALGRSHASEKRYGSSQDGGYQQFLGRLVEFIPGDVVAGYVVVLGLIPQDAGDVAIWVTAIVFLAITPAIVVLGAGTPVVFTRRLVFRAVAAMIAYCTWVVALPQSPVPDVPGWLRSLLLIAVTIVLTPIDQNLNDD